MKTNIVVRIRILCGFFILIALLIGVRLYFVQIVHGHAYGQDAVAQYVEPNPDTENRGSIFFTSKDAELISGAVMQTGWRIALQPERIDNPAHVFDLLNAIVPIDRERFMTSAAKKTDPYEEVAFRIDDTAATKIRALKIPGVLLVQDQWRLYPGGNLAAQTLGFVGYQGDSKVGVYGLERYYQSTLAMPTSGLYVNPFAEIFANIQAALTSDPAAHHGSIVTSIEPTVQHSLDSALDSVMKTYTPRIVGGIIMDPHTGEIIAMSVQPGFDPNAYSIVDDPTVFSNPLVEGRYELGSIMKPLTVAAGIDTGAVTRTTTYNDTGCIERSGKTICNFDRKARNVVPVQEILNQSLNVGATFVADKMGHPTFTRYMKAYGFSEKTGIDIPNEVTGDISALGTGNGPDVNYASAAFGQSVAISPIEMIRALSVLANQGTLPTPHLVTAIKYESGITRHIKPASGPQVLKPETTDIVTDMLTEVYDKALLKGKLKMEHYSIAAKTGTAQIAQSHNGGYYTDRFLHSFFGYFPSHDPKFIVFLFAVEPHGAEFASATLAEPFSEIAKFMINYYAIPPDR